MTNIFDELPMNSKLNVYYMSCKASEDFSEKMLEWLKGVLQPSKKEQLITSIYYSLHCWIKTIVALNSTIHVQAVASGARSIYEQLLDLKLIADDKVSNAVERFEAFREIEIFRMAKKFSDFRKAHPDAKATSREKRIQYALNKDNQNKVEQLKKQWFSEKGSRTDHWSGLKTEKRAELAGIEYEKFYNESFAILSWYVHAGQVGTRTKELLELVYGDSMRLVHEMFVDAVFLTARAMKFDKAFEGFNDWIQELKLEPGRVILEEEKKYFESLGTNKEELAQKH